jgi:formate dehydrogenase major subunit
MPAPEADIDETAIRVSGPERTSAGLTAVRTALAHAVGEMGVARTSKTLRRVNQADGFDCQGCAWADPDPGHRHAAEFCENGAKAVAEEGTLRRVGPEFFARHTIADLDERSDYWLGQQGRLTHPMVRRPGADRYEQIGWDEALTLIGDHLGGLASPDEAVFYTSGRTSNEAAFSYGLLARAFGTNNLPDCSNMCHESTSVALAEVIGIGKGSVSLEDVHAASLIVIAGQNPGTNHPRMLSALETAKKRGARILAINPLPEAGLINFRNPQTPRGIVGSGTDLADRHLAIRVNGDLPLFQAIGALILEAEEAAADAGRPGAVLDRAFIEASTEGFEEWAANVRALDWDHVLRATGLTREEIEAAAAMFIESPRTVICWAMGITQHRNAVATIKEFVNVALLQGNIGRPGAGLCPVRGHSNVQGDRTMGIWERPPAWFLDAIGTEFGFSPPREPGLAVVEAIRALRDGRARVFIGMGGNFAAATPDSEVTFAALRSADLTVQVSTKLNRSHVVCGRTALILPALGRSERDVQASGEQFVTVEDSMSSVHASRGRLDPAGPLLRSEMSIVCGIARALAGRAPAVAAIDWDAFESDYDAVRAHIARVIPGCEDYSRRAAQPGGFTLPHPPRDRREFTTPSKRAVFSASPAEVVTVPEGRLLLQTLRSHDQFNTTIYGLDDRYRGISGGRRVVFLHPDDITAFGLEDGQRVDLVSEWEDGAERRVRGFRVVPYPTPRGCAAAYYPETNPLVPLDSVALGSLCPASKSVIIRLEPPAPAPAPTAVPAAGAAHKDAPQPPHMS